MPNAAQYAKLCEDSTAYAKYEKAKKKYNESLIKCCICHLEMKKLHYNRYHQCLPNLFGWND